jgi:hypothetical protein
MLMFGSAAYAQQNQMSAPAIAATKAVYTERIMETEPLLPLGRYFLVDLSDLKSGKNDSPSKFNGRPVSMEEVFTRKWNKDNVQEFVFFGDSKETQNLILLLPRNLKPQSIMASGLISRIQNCDTEFMMPRLQTIPTVEGIQVMPAVKAND